MIGEASGVTTLINNERIQRENQVSSESRSSDQGEELGEQNFSDVTSFSAEALALAKNVVPVGGSAEEGQLEQQGQDQTQNSTARLLDIRV
ncbi:MAG: hypothetical protein GY799_33235 [Desulfobulbaceae bacterium]|nr:hypothetical protein [Desulfobulbaceae bacterium]